MGRKLHESNYLLEEPFIYRDDSKYTWLVQKSRGDKACVYFILTLMSHELTRHLDEHGEYGEA